MTRYAPARHYLPGAVAAFALSVFSGWCGWNWKPAFVPAFLLLFSSGLLLFLATRPVIIIRDKSLSVGDRSYLWSEVESLDTTGWSVPLVLNITLRGDRFLRLIYAGDPESAGRLLRQMRRLARGARIDSLPAILGRCSATRRRGRRIPGPAVPRRASGR
ncbi:MAG: hypothetical protein HY236_13060 [Acidobacteria bacterium]|nr:hypothetical protein [Acidobacteriota bacterium]